MNSDYEFYLVSNWTFSWVGFDAKRIGSLYDRQTQTMSFILSQTELSPSSLGNGLMLNASSLSTTDKLLQLTLWVLKLSQTELSPSSGWCSTRQLHNWTFPVHLFNAQCVICLSLVSFSESWHARAFSVSLSNEYSSLLTRRYPNTDFIALNSFNGGGVSHFLLRSFLLSRCRNPGLFLWLNANWVNFSLFH